jgi:zinc transport system substrate-binding protein
MTLHKPFRIPQLLSSPILMRLLIWLLVLFAARGGSAMADPIPVAVSILPQKHFVEKIAGKRVEVMVMVRPGASPATYEPRPGQMLRLNSAALYFAIGVPFETTWLPRITALNPDLTIIHTEQGIHRLPMTRHDHEAHSTHKKNTKNQVYARKHEIVDPHIWLAPNLVKIQASNITQGLISLDPTHAREYEDNYAAFLSELDEVNRRITDILNKIPADRRTFMVFHPSWGYFARAYDLRQLPIEFEGKEPGPGELARIIARGKQLNIGAVFVQQQFSARSASLIARSMSAEVIPLDPLAENWRENILETARIIASTSRRRAGRTDLPEPGGDR